MALNYPINENQTDAKSPIDEQLMGDIRLNLEDIDDRLIFASSSDFSFRVNGNLDFLNLENDPNGGRELDVGYITRSRTLSLISIYLDKAGEKGELEVDVKKLKYQGYPIASIESLFSANTQSITRSASPLLTQSITKAENDLLTQAINYAKAVESIESVVLVNAESAYYRYNLGSDVPLDSDYQVGDTVVISGCNTAGNDGTFVIIDLNVDGARNIIVQNFTGVNDTISGGSVQLALVEYEFLASVPDNFAIGENVLMSGHTDLSNDGTFEIVKRNVGGNNLIVKRNTALTSQGAPAGSVSIFRFQYNFSTPVNINYVLGEEATFSGHTDPSNDGTFEIKVLNNNGGDNIVIYNEAGLVQAGIVGEVLTNRWVYALDVDPDGFILVNDKVVFSGHTDPSNDGTFEVLTVKYLSTNNVVVYNANAVEQLAPAGALDHAQKAVIFKNDYASGYVAGKSFITIQDTIENLNDGVFRVLDINRLSISSYNLIIETSAPTQAFAAGIIENEFKSVFVNESVKIDIIRDRQFSTLTKLDNEIIDEDIAEDTIILLDVLKAPKDSENLSVTLK